MGKKRVAVFTSSKKEPTSEKEFKELLLKVLQIEFNNAISTKK